ncbi:MAG TPA: serine protease [Gemmatimonadaceae bacterium]|jgi:hypothetical protein
MLGASWTNKQMWARIVVIRKPRDSRMSMPGLREDEKPFPWQIHLRECRDTVDMVAGCFGTGVVVDRAGSIVTAYHNVTDVDDTPFDWVWVCRYDAQTLDWTAAFPVKVEARRCEPDLDIAILEDERLGIARPAPLATSWKIDDPVSVIGFERDVNRASGCCLHVVRGRIQAPVPTRPPMAIGNLMDGANPTGLSGGPVINHRLWSAPAIAVQQLAVPGQQDAIFQLRAMPVSWFRTLFD